MSTFTASCQPVPNATTPFWRTELHPLDSYGSTEDLPSHSDIVVIGAGYAGASTVHHILEECESPPKILILEAREACSGASGRNGGHIKPDVYYNILKYSQKYGAQQAAAFAAFEARNVLAVKKMVEEESIECDFVLTRAIDVYLDSAHAQATREAYLRLTELGTADLSDVDFVEGEPAEKLSGVKDAKSCFSYTAAHLWPYKLVMHLLKKAVDRGVNLQTHTPVKTISEERDAQGHWTITTNRGKVKTPKLIICTNGYTASVAPQFHEKIVPVRGICSRVMAKEPSKTTKLQHTYSLRHGKSLYDYMIPRQSDNSLVLGGAKPPYWHDKSQWYNNVDDSTPIEPAISYFDGYMQRHFHGWEASGAYTDRIWTGIMGWSADFMPWIGEVPGKTEQHICAGFSGHGMPLIHLSSEAVARMVVKGDRFEQTGLPFVFKPTRERLESEVNEILGTSSRKS